jgi:hypothetical protein
MAQSGNQAVGRRGGLRGDGAPKRANWTENSVRQKRLFRRPDHTIAGD